MRTADYNGWTNYETWAVALWIDNDQGEYSYWMEQAEELKGDDTPSWVLGDALKDYHEDMMPSVNGVYADLLSGALSEVQWSEVAEHILEAVDNG